MYIETERLMITDLTPDMAQVIHENSLDEDNRRFVPDEVFETVEDAQETVEFLISQYGNGEGPQLHAIITKAEHQNIGYVQLAPLGEHVWEIGYHIAKKYTGNGYATEAVKAYLPVMAEAMNVKEIYGICVAENTASHKIMAKCGFENLHKGEGSYQGETRNIVKNIWRAGNRMP